MCGFYGVSRRSEKVDPADLRARVRRLSHRGPDGEGAWVSPDGRAGLAHRRLAVVDLSERARQPMSGSAGRRVLVFNGELYGFHPLRRELEALGARFRGDGDSEVLLAAYSIWGEACLSKIQGMFAFAVVEVDPAGEAAAVFLARDRVGKKPLYYRLDDGTIEFASELKALLGTGGLDPEALNHYLARGYVPRDLCLAQGVRKLPPGHVARFDCHSGAFRIWRYWDIPSQDGAFRSQDDLKEEAEDLLRGAVETRLHADVPVGVFLSGGLDSALVTAFAAKAASTPIHTFTVKMEGSRLDESSRAGALARHFKTRHHELRLGPMSLRSLEEFLPFVDEPIGDSSILPTFQVSRLAREHITVALSGDGGDEIFGGYDDYPTTLRELSVFGWLPNAAVTVMSALAGDLPAGIRGRGKLVSWRGGIERQMAWGTPYFDSDLRRRILAADVAEACVPFEAPEIWLESLMKGRDPVDRMTRAHFHSILPDDFLVKVDRASMANGLEVRCPYLDPRLVEFSFGRLASRWKVHAGVTRRLQRSIAADLLPAGLDFSRKQGFSIPFDDWLRADSCRWLREQLSALPGAIRRSAVEGLIQGEMSGRANGSRLFNLLMLSAACRNMGWT